MYKRQGYAEVKIFSGVSVAASAWASDSTYAAYPYAASIACLSLIHISQVNNAEVELNKLDSALNKNASYLDEAAKSSDGCARCV